MSGEETVALEVAAARLERAVTDLVRASAGPRVERQRLWRTLDHLRCLGGDLPRALLLIADRLDESGATERSTDPHAGVDALTAAELRAAARCCSPLDAAISRAEHGLAPVVD